ncbi:MULTISPECIES: hypothetical protein [unclassified Mucilaginibacter]|uniref:hypothetical protein n=1 Tax=unclassified Mucilaginibacter TaxID=2617802 RepID=UPI0031F6475C
MPEYLNFRIVDKSTNADLFFANQPAYAIGQLKVTYKKLERPVQVKSDGTSGNYFSVQANIAGLKDTMYIQVGNNAAVPLIYTLAKVEDPCPRYPVSTVMYNNNFYNNVGAQILSLKQ